MIYILQLIAHNLATDQAVFEAIMAKTDDPSVLQLIEMNILSKRAIANNNYLINLIYKRACRFERISLKTI